MAHSKRQRSNNLPSTINPLLGDLDSLLSEPEMSPISAPIDPTAGLVPAVPVDDRRFFNPDPFPVPSTVFGTPATVGPVPNSFRETRRMMEFGMNPMEPVRHAIRQFNVPGQVLECVKRKVRKEVMFSLPQRKRRKGAGARRRRDDWSDYHC